MRVVTTYEFDYNKERRKLLAFYLKIKNLDVVSDDVIALIKELLFVPITRYKLDIHLPELLSTVKTLCRDN